MNATRDASEPGHTIAFGHVGLQVRDLSASVAFYAGVIGLEEVERLVRQEPYLAHVTGYPGVELHIALLAEPASGVLLELLEYRGVARAAIDPATANPGTGHVCFEVDDVDAIHRRAVAAGYGAVNVPVTPTAGRWKDGRSVYLLDPDGIRVELVNRGPRVEAGTQAPGGPGGVGVTGSGGTEAPQTAPASEAVFLVEATFAPDAEERRRPYRAAHLGRIAELRRQGIIIEGGAFLDALTTSVMLIRAATAADARRVAEEDPYVAAGVWQDVRVRPFGRVVT